MGLFNYLFGSKNDLKIEVLHGIVTVQSPFVSGITNLTIELKITNNSGQNIFIENPCIETPIKNTDLKVNFWRSEQSINFAG